MTRFLPGLLVVLVVGCASAPDAAGPPPSSEAATPTPEAATPVETAAQQQGLLDFTAAAVGGGEVVGADYAGRDLALWFWAPW